MSWDQIGQLAEEGVEFAAHTCTHANLSSAERGQVRYEIQESKKEIERRLGKTITGFAYPYGYDPGGYVRLIPVLEELGFDYAVTSWWGSNIPRTNPYLLYRDVLNERCDRTLIKRELLLDMVASPVPLDSDAHHRVSSMAARRP